MLKKYCLSIMFMVLLSVSSFANLKFENPYISAQYSALTHSEESLGLDFNYSTIGLILGANIYNQISVEGRIALGTSKDGFETTAGGVDYDYETGISSAISVFLRADHQIAEKFKVYGLLGYTNLILDNTLTATTYGVSYESASASTSSTSLSYGLGLEGKINNSLSAMVEYVQYFTNLSGYSFGIKYLL